MPFFDKMSTFVVRLVGIISQAIQKGAGLCQGRFPQLQIPDASATTEDVTDSYHQQSRFEFNRKRRLHQRPWTTD